jgi:protein SCO1/2
VKTTATRSAALVALPLVALCAGAVRADTPIGPRSAAAAGARDYFTDLPLVTHEGKQVRFYSDVLKDRIVLISSFYTNCTGITPRQVQVLSQLQAVLGESLGRDVFIVSITVDPVRDTPEKIKQYAEDLGARPGWIFLTGKPDNVNWVNSKLGQYLENLEDHKGVYLLGKVKTTLWMKVPAHALSLDLYRQIQRLRQDRGEPETS